METIVALFDDVATAKIVIQELKDIGLTSQVLDIDIQSGKTETTVVSASVIQPKLLQATQIMYRHNPIQIDRDDLQWRRNETILSEDFQARDTVKSERSDQ